MGQVITAFAGRRDWYQVPVAFAEVGRLRMHVADISPHLVNRLRGQRAADVPLPKSLVKTAAFGEWARREFASRILGAARGEFHSNVSRQIGKGVAGLASHSDAILVTHDVWEQTPSLWNLSNHSAVFQFHPHSDHLVREYDRWLGINNWDAAVDDTLLSVPSQAVARADVVVVASSFTKRGLVEAGLDPLRIRVTPYGVGLPGRPNLATRRGDWSDTPLRLLWVGQVTRRKGLHILLTAVSRLRDLVKLTCVTGAVHSPELLDDLPPNVRVLSGLRRRDLEALYADSHLLAMPSVAEGFGLVITEALEVGTPFIATPNTAAPDVLAIARAGELTAVGDAEALQAAITRLARERDRLVELHRGAEAVAATLTWDKFRQQLRDIVPCDNGGASYDS